MYVLTNKSKKKLLFINKIQKKLYTLECVFKMKLLQSIQLLSMKIKYYY